MLDETTIAPGLPVKEGGQLTGSSSGLVSAVRLVRAGEAGDPASPGISGLFCASIWIRQAVIGGHIHHHKGIEHHIEPPRLDGGNGAFDGIVRGCAAIGGTAIDMTDNGSAGAGKARDRPLIPTGLLVARIDARSNSAIACAQVCAEPTHHKRDALQIRAGGHKMIERGGKLGARLKHIAVFARPLTLRRLARDFARVIAKFR